MNRVPAYMREFEYNWRMGHPNDPYLPPYLTGPVEEGYLSQHMLEEAKRGVPEEEPQERLGLLEADASTSHIKLKPGTQARCTHDVQLSQEPQNTFWIAVSGYQIDRAYLVYRFFHDIGRIVAKSFTHSNLMYIKYFSILDCEIALSYDGQKIGYGGDIRVRVKPENPMMENPFLGALEKSLQNNEDEPGPSRCFIPLEDNEPEQEVVEEEPPTLPKKLTFMEWLREKLSYMFYFY